MLAYCRIGATSFVALYSIQRFGLSASTVSIALTVFPAGGAVGTLVGGVLAHRYDRKISIRSGYLLALCQLDQSVTTGAVVRSAPLWVSAP
ncbi:MFS transporter [Streptomyces sp. H23]|uniref:MFS transporter n=1 Tax=Streptomyces sp. H23 TaxID=2541723 RepID=UPI001430E479|nr:MFS transporter [Streptomyces sp. H23]